jgi:hypothetical protein
MAFKAPALLWMGGGAMNYGFHPAAVVGGLATHLAICGFFGMVYAHFTGTNNLKPLLGVGLAWGAFSWIFIGNLFTPSVRPVFVAAIPQGATFFVWMAYGVSLVTTSFYDRMLRR